MNRDQIAQTAIAHWRAHHRKTIKGLTSAEVEAKGIAVAHLALAEIEALESIGVDRETAWVDIRNTMVMRPPENAGTMLEQPQPDAMAVLRGL